MRFAQCQFSVRESLLLTTIIALSLCCVITTRREARMRTLVYPQWMTFYEEDGLSSDREGLIREFKVTIYLTEEEFAELYPDEYEWQVKVRKQKHAQ